MLNKSCTHLYNFIEKLKPLIFFKWKTRFIQFLKFLLRSKCQLFVVVDVLITFSLYYTRSKLFPKWTPGHVGNTPSPKHNPLIVRGGGDTLFPHPCVNTIINECVWSSDMDHIYLYFTPGGKQVDKGGGMMGGGGGKIILFFCWMFWT